MVKQIILKYSKLLSLVVLIALIGCEQNQEKLEKDSIMATNVFLQEWEGPYQGVPAQRWFRQSG